MKQQVLALSLLAIFVSGIPFAWITPAPASQSEEPSPPRPSVINSVYTVTIFGGADTIHLWEEGGCLKMSVQNQDGELPSPVQSIEYARIRHIRVYDLSRNGKPVMLQIEDSEGRVLYVTLRTDEEAKEAANYVARQVNPPLLLVSGEWRVRQRFACPEGSQPGCQDFKELLDHDDPEIVGYMYHPKSSQTYACFSSEERRFFIVQYEHFPTHDKRGSFHQKVFKEGQEDFSSSRYTGIEWSMGDSGEITDKHSQKPQTVGWLDDSLLSYHNKFTNAMNTTTQYELSIRWSTGRYTETYSGKDHKGEPFHHGYTGVCSKLN